MQEVVRAIGFNDSSLKGMDLIILSNQLGRLGYEVSLDGDTGLLTATKPEVIPKELFKEVVGTVDSPYFGGFAWGRLRHLKTYHQEIADSPVRFLRGGYNGLSDSLVADTLEPTIEWATEHVGEFGINNRTMAAWGTVNQAYLDGEILPTIVGIV